jgi:fatty acid-binding protein DegV
MKPSSNSSTEKKKVQDLMASLLNSTKQLKNYLQCFLKHSEKLKWKELYHTLSRASVTVIPISFSYKKKVNYRAVSLTNIDAKTLK